MYAVQGVFFTKEIFPTATLPRIPECRRYSQSNDFRGVGKDTKTAKLGMYAWGWMYPHILAEGLLEVLPPPFSEASRIVGWIALFSRGGGIRMESNVSSEVAEAFRQQEASCSKLVGPLRLLGHF